MVWQAAAPSRSAAATPIALDGICVRGRVRRIACWPCSCSSSALQPAPRPMRAARGDHGNCGLRLQARDLLLWIVRTAVLFGVRRRGRTDCRQAHYSRFALRSDERWPPRRHQSMLDLQRNLPGCGRIDRLILGSCFPLLGDDAGVGQLPGHRQVAGGMQVPLEQLERSRRPRSSEFRRRSRGLV